MATICISCHESSKGKNAVVAAHFYKGRPLCGACFVSEKNNETISNEKVAEPSTVKKVEMAPPGPKGPVSREGKGGSMELCEVCKGDNRREKGHTGRHTGFKLNRPQAPRKAKAASSASRSGGSFSGATEAIASEIDAIDSQVNSLTVRRKKLAAALAVLEDL